MSVRRKTVVNVSVEGEKITLLIGAKDRREELELHPETARELASDLFRAADMSEHLKDNSVSLEGWDLVFDMSYESEVYQATVYQRENGAFAYVPMRGDINEITEFKTLPEAMKYAATIASNKPGGRLQ